MMLDVLQTVWVSTSFIGFHRWVDAPEDVKYLRDWHRHVFKVGLYVTVTHGNRQVEFHQLKRELDTFLLAEYVFRTYFEFSCEQIAEQIGREFWKRGYTTDMVTVNEDDENGAVVRFNHIRPSGEVHDAVLHPA